MKRQRMIRRAQPQSQMPQYEQQQYQQVQGQEQLPPEVAQATPEYSQFPGYEQGQSQQMPAQQVQMQMPQQQMPTPQYPQQAPQASTMREVKPVFRSSGGKPYPAVDTTPLANNQMTIPQGYVENVDSFTGKRYIKKLPTTEKWAGGGY